MKKFIIILILLFSQLFAQNRSNKNTTKQSKSNTVIGSLVQKRVQNVPRRISYQGLITKSDGSPTTDGSYEVLFKLYDTPNGGDPVWSENLEVTVNNGIISTILGEINPFATIPEEAYLELTVDGSTLSPRQSLTSVFYSVLSDTAGYANTADYDELINLPDLDVYVLKDSLDSYTTSEDLFDTLSNYQQLDSNLTDLVEDGILSSSKIEYGITSEGSEGQSWISDGEGSGEWGIPTALAADDIITGDGNINIQTTGGGINIDPSEGSLIVLDSVITIQNTALGITSDNDLINLSPDTITVSGTVVASSISGGAVLDEDDMASDSDTHLATQQSIKSYIDTKQDADENLETIADLEQGDGNFIVSDGVEWTVENNEVARNSLGLGSIATQNTNEINIDGGAVDGTPVGSESPASGSFTTLNVGSGATVGDLTLNSGTITDNNGTISFGDEDLITTGTISTETGSTIGRLTLSDGSITDSGGNISFGDENLSTTGTLTAGISNLSSATTIGDLTLANGTITDESGTISFGSDNLSTAGTLDAGIATFNSGTEIGDITISNGSIMSSSDEISFGNDALVTTGTLNAGVTSLAEGSNIGSLTLEDGSITDSGGAISFGDENLTTTGTLNAAAGSSLGDLTFSDGSITDSGGAISFDNENLATTGTITANSFTGDGSNLTGVEATSTGVLAGTSPIILEGETSNDFETTLSLVDPTADRTITLPNVTGTIITTENDNAIDQVGTISSGIWQGTEVADAFVEDDLTITGGSINNTIIGATNPAAGNFTTVVGSTADVGTVSIGDGSITDSDGAISFGDENISTTGSLASGTQAVTGNVTASGTVSAEQLTTTDDLTVEDEASIDGTMTIATGSITDLSGSISFGDENISTTGNLNAGVTTLSTGSGIGNLTLEDGSITDSGGAISFDNENLSTTGTLASGAQTVTGNITASGTIRGNAVTVDDDLTVTDQATIDGTLNLASGVITDSDGSISFGNENLTTSGTFSSGVATIASGSTIGNLTLSDGAIGSGSDAITFGNDNLTTTGTMTASSFSGDGSNLTGLEATSIGTLSGATPLILEGGSANDFETTLAVEDPSADRTITFPNISGTVLTTGNETSIDQVGTITSGTWQGTVVADDYVANDLTLSGAAIDNSVIGGTTPAAATFTTVAGTSLNITGSNGVTLENGETITNSTDGTLLITSPTTSVSGDLSVGTSLQTATVDYTDGDVAMTIADGGAVTFGQEAQFSSGIQTAGSVETATIDYTDGDVAMTIADGGGVTTSGDLAVTDDLSLASDAAVLSMGADGDVSLTHVADTGVLLNAASEIQFRDNALKINSSTDGQLDIDADTEVEITATTVDLNGALDVSGNITVGTSVQTATVDYTDGDLAITIADGGGITVAQNAVFSGTVTSSGFTGNLTGVATTGTNVVITDNESTNENNAIAFVANADLDGNSSIGLESDGNLYYNPSTGTVTATAFVGDGSNLTGITASTIGTLTGTNAIAFRDSDLNINSSTDGQLDINADTKLDIDAPNTEISGDLKVTGNDISFGNSESISNANDGDFLFTTGTDDGALILKNSNTTNGVASIELVSDNAGDDGDGYELKSVNGTFTITSDHSTSGTYNDTYVTIAGNSNPTSSTVTIAGELSATTLDIGGTNISATATELNYTDVNTLGTSEASKAVTVDSNGDLIVPDSDKYKFGTGSDMQLYHDGSNSYITNATGALKVATETSGIAVTIGHSTSETTVADNLTVAGNAAVTGDLTVTDNDITFGNGETISNATNGDFLFTTGTTTGALIVKNSDASNGIASIELVSDNGADLGDGYEIKSLNGALTFTSDHSSSGTYNDTYLTIDGNSSPASSTITVAGELSATTLDIGGTNISATATELNYNDITTLGTSQASKAVTVNSSGDLIVPDSDKFQFGSDSDMSVYHDGSNAYITNSTGGLKLATQASGIAVTIGHSTSETTVADNLTVAGDAAVTGGLTVTGNQITFGNSETISNATNGDFLFTTGTTDGALTLKNSETSDGIASIELVSDNGADQGDGYELKSINGVFTITSDHSSTGTYNDTYVTVTGNADPTASTTTIAGDLVVNGGQIAVSGDADLMTLASGIVTVAGEISATTLDIGGTNISADATELNKMDGVTATTAELNYTDITTLGTSEASKVVTVDSNGDLIVPDSDKYTFGGGSDMQLYHDGSNSYITNSTGALKVATETSGIAVTIGHTVSETTVADNLNVTGAFSYNSKIVSTKSNGATLTVAESGSVILQSTDSAIINLPATQLGLRYTFIWIGTAGQEFDISPNASDKIMGSIVDVADGNIVTASSNGAGTDDKDLQLDNGSKVGDRVTIVGDGANGWYIEEAVGSWAFQGS